MKMRATMNYTDLVEFINAFEGSGVDANLIKISKFLHNMEFLTRFGENNRNIVLSNFKINWNKCNE